MRTPLIAANWKMNKTIGEALSFAGTFLDILYSQGGESFPVEIVICPPFTAVPALCATFAGKNVSVGGQNLYWEEKGAFTGEISPVMLRDAGCKYVIVGHSERRRLFAENDEMVAKKVRSALDHGLRPIVCVGETLEERDEGRTFEVCEGQVRRDLSLVKAQEIPSIVIAYEPVWAIGTGKEARPDDAGEVIVHIRETVNQVFGPGTSQNLRVLYGGSVKSSNIRQFMLKEEIDGALVGGASLDPEEFFKIALESKKAKAKS
ncbi:MAG TPA: triose-phosphate isomerase [Firmicutes bacterium]|nr:triose-phosphate isomerase [Candidatus Fermentithermobacillaceae bacterium]